MSSSTCSFAIWCHLIKSNSTGGICGWLWNCPPWSAAATLRWRYHLFGSRRSFSVVCSFTFIYLYILMFSEIPTVQYVCMCQQHTLAHVFHKRTVDHDRMWQCDICERQNITLWALAGWMTWSRIILHVSFYMFLHLFVWRRWRAIMSLSRRAEGFGGQQHESATSEPCRSLTVCNSKL